MFRNGGISATLYPKIDADGDIIIARSVATIGTVFTRPHSIWLSQGYTAAICISLV